MYNDNAKKIFFFLLILSGVAFAKIPKWFNETELPDYPLDFYITGTGNGASYDDAVLKAQATIASQLRVTIKSELTSIETEINENDRVSYAQMIESTSNSVVDEKIEGIEIIKKEESEAVYYVFAVLSKEKFTAGLETELDNLRGQIVSLVSNARKLKPQGKIFAALENYTDAQEIIPVFYSKMAFYNAIAMVPYSLEKEITLGEINSEIRDILAGIQISLVSGDNQTGEPGKPLPEPVVFQVVYRQGTGGESTPIPKMPLIVKYGDGNLIEKLTSDQSGKAVCYVTAYSGGTAMGKIVASPNLYRLPTLYRKYLNKAECSARFNVSEETKIICAVDIRDDNGKTLASVERNLSRAVEQLGHVVNPESNILLKGVVVITSTKEIEGYGGKQFVVGSELSLAMINRTTKEEMASLVADGKGMDKVEKKAVEAAYNNVKVGKKELAEMIAEAEGIAFARIEAPEPVPQEAAPKPVAEPVAESNLLRKVTREGFTVELQRWELADRDLTLYLEVTNDEEDDRDFTVYYGNPFTDVYDNLGNEYKIFGVKMANNKYQFPGYGRLTLKLVSEVPVKAELYFHGISKKAERISLLHINCGDLQVEFRDMPLQR